MENGRSIVVSKIESYAVDIDGVRRIEHQSFVEAVKAAMEFRQKLPASQIKVCDASEPTAVSDRKNAPVAA